MFRSLYGLFLILATAASLSAAEYFVDSENGSDAHDGRSEAAAWQTLTAVNNAPLQPGDIVRFKRGGLWRGALNLRRGDEGNDIVYSSYGEGDKPRIYGSIPLNSPDDWTEAEPGLWVAYPKAVAERDGTAPQGVNDIGNIIINGTSAAWKKWTKEDLTAQADFWYDLNGDSALWFRSFRNPAILYGTLEAAVMHHVVNHTYAAWDTVEGLDIRYGAAHGFGGGDLEHLTIRDCDISWIGGGDQYLGGGEGRRVRFGNGIEFWGTALDCVVENCRIWEVYDAALTNQGMEDDVERNITYRNNTIWNSEYSFEYWNGATSRTENILFEGNVCRFAGYGWGHVQRPDKNGRHLMFYRNSAKTENFVIRNNVFEDSVDSLVRLELCPENERWAYDNLTLSGNAYSDSQNRTFFLWYGQKIGPDEFQAFCAEAGLEQE